MISEPISDDIPPQINFEYGYPYSNALLTFSFQKDSENVLDAPIRPATPAA